jgi:transcriptional regulator with XRE-family HTH domain
MMKDGVKHRFGDKLREIRERKGITMKAVADKVGVSESLISQIERNRVSPSIDTLFAAAEALEIDLDYLFRDYRHQRKVRIVRREEQTKVTTRQVTYTQLSVMPDFSEEHAIEAFLMEIEPDGEKGSGDYGHPGRELGYVLDGQAELIYGIDTHELRKGDSVSFSSDVPHVLRNIGGGPFRAVWVITPPKMLFFRE